MTITAYRSRAAVWAWLGLAMLVTCLIYAPGLSGGWLFDDYPNIVDNRGVQPSGLSIANLVGAALSSPASDFKRPLSSLSFAVNYLAAGLDPYWMKLTNLVIHLLNGLLVFWLTRGLLLAAAQRAAPHLDESGQNVPLPPTAGNREQPESRWRRPGSVAVLLAAAWMALPINLTGVLYVVQRMESMANLFVLLGLAGYLSGRRRMLAARNAGWGGFACCLASLVLGSGMGALAKETAVMLPLYALLVEWVLFGFRAAGTEEQPIDWRVIGLFVVLLVLPMLAGMAWLLPSVLSPESWATRDFTLGTRLLSEARIVVGYIGWTLLPLPHELSFYHDDVVVSTGLLQPWTTLASLLVLAGLLALLVAVRRQRPLVSLGLGLFLGCHLLTGTILPLELVYEHRNYFASFGLLLAVVPILAGPVGAPATGMGSAPAMWARHAVLGALLVWWAGLTAMTAYSWGEPLRLAQELARRAPASPRAQYELGRTYIIYSHYDPGSPYTRAAYAPLERAAALPESSILPQQALIFMNARMGLPLKDAWWDSMIAKLKARPPGVQDESSLSALTQCAREGVCHLPEVRMVEAFRAALSHPNPSARLLATYSDYAWNTLGDHALGQKLIEQAISTAPQEPAYRITCIRMLLSRGQFDRARQALKELETLNFGGRLDGSIAELRSKLPSP